MELFYNEKGIKFKSKRPEDEPIMAGTIEEFSSDLKEKNITFKEVLSDIIDDSISSPYLGCIDIYTPPMWDGLYIGQYMRGDFIEMAPMEIIKAYFDNKVNFIKAIKKNNHIDYHITIGE